MKNKARICEGQKNVCNQTVQMRKLSINLDLSLENVFGCTSGTLFVSSAWNCPENSFCSPYGPGFFECSCLHNFHGYKCMRQVRFPTKHPQHCSFIAHVHNLFSIAGRVPHRYGAWDTHRIHSCGFICTLVHTKTKGRDHLNLTEKRLLE